MWCGSCEPPAIVDFPFTHFIAIRVEVPAVGATQSQRDSSVFSGPICQSIPDIQTPRCVAKGKKKHFPAAYWQEKWRRSGFFLFPSARKQTDPFTSLKPLRVFPCSYTTSLWGEAWQGKPCVCCPAPALNKPALLCSLKTMGEKSRPCAASWSSWLWHHISFFKLFDVPL